MRRALALAACGRGTVEPNPMVGAVLVRDGRIIGEGRHLRFGGPHAEAEALSAAAAAGQDARGATAYVTLEPCGAFAGKKTPPCVEALIAAGVARAVVAMPDPNPEVSGRSLGRLREAGIEVVTGVCEVEARKLLAGYVKLRTVGRPWVICKWAQTADGCLALPPGRGRWVSGEQARAWVHQLRGRCDGILVGVGTVLADDPLLTNRSGKGRQPARVVLDTGLRTSANSRLLQSAAESPVILVAPADAEEPAPELAGCAGVEILRVPSRGAGVDPGALLDELGRRQWTYLLVEGGAKVLASFVVGGFADELVVFVSPDRAAGGPPLPRFDIAEVRRKLGLPEPEETRRLGRDTMLRFLLR